MDAQSDDSWPVSLTVERDLDGTHRAPVADDAVVVCPDDDLPGSFGATDVTLAPLCATKRSAVVRTISSVGAWIRQSRKVRTQALMRVTTELTVSMRPSHPESDGETTSS